MKFYLTRDKAPGSQDYKMWVCTGKTKPLSERNRWEDGIDWVRAHQTECEKFFQIDARTFHKLAPGRQLKPGECKRVLRMDFTCGIEGPTKDWSVPT